MTKKIPKIPYYIKKNNTVNKLTNFKYIQKVDTPFLDWPVVSLIQYLFPHDEYEQKYEKGHCCLEQVSHLLFYFIKILIYILFLHNYICIYLFFVLLFGNFF